MSTPRALLLLVPALLLFAGCGESDDGGADRDASRSGATGDATPSEQPRPGEPESGGRAGAASESFALTPQVTACMERAGYTQDAPPTGGLAAWRHPTGARAVVASGPDVTAGIASEIGSEQQPANVEGTLVIAAVPALADAAEVCLG